ncbi:hypothetical protein DM860_004130 [Cuscuta australis]|uniref:Uncharacterized protein n=1 Tax=Cuscuta australis TaxID=267555 RepID=A0A328CXQ0_9ASTE|nr:hypothetical protein DM860_004130 [Cuscuta australis]
MEATNRWYRSFSTGGRSIQLGRHHYYAPGLEHGYDDRAARNGLARKGSIWRQIWRKFSKEKTSKNEKKKKNVFEFSRSVHVQVPKYDEHSYSQNFDKGSSNWDEPDRLFKSFSVRYADPSRVTFLIDLNTS